ncbi:MAG: Fic family protein [Lachnospiraceae bacterium]|nr:Fic family protein [Lachnospiraceae bacterium]
MWSGFRCTDCIRSLERVMCMGSERTGKLGDILQEEMRHRRKGGIYHKVQIELTYNSNHIEGSRLTHEETRYIYETNTIGLENKSYNVDDIMETVNHFRCIDYMIEHYREELTEKIIKELHYILKVNTSDSTRAWFSVGDYKKLPNEVGEKETSLPEKVSDDMRELIWEYHRKDEKSLEDILEFHVRFERIHPFQDGNGRVGRLLLFKECLKNQIVPFIIEDDVKLFYYRGLKEWGQENGYLTDTCLSCQDQFKKYLDYFRITMG